MSMLIRRMGLQGDAGAELPVKTSPRGGGYSPRKRTSLMVFERTILCSC